MIDLKQDQQEQDAWTVRNFGEQPVWHPVFGMVEELGELCHAILKFEQGIRTGTNKDAAIADMRDAIGDLIIYTMGTCNSLARRYDVEFDMEEILMETWSEVKQRDWHNNPETGVSDD